MTAIHRTLVSADDLRRVDAAALRLVDCSFDLADVDAGERLWRAGHPPGSVYLHLDRDLCGAKTGRNGRHPLPARAVFVETLGRCGIGPATQVVAFDRQGGMVAARLWWMLRWMGHEAVAVLDGGIDAWVAAGGAMTADLAATPVPAGPYPEHPAAMPTIDADGVADGLGRLVLLDARAAERFRGEVEPLDAAAGHIPGARNRFFKDNLRPDGRFKPADALRREFDALLGSRGADAIVHQCGSGVSACHNVLAMAHAGLDGGRLYPGSWSEWSADPARPVAVSARAAG